MGVKRVAWLRDADSMDWKRELVMSLVTTDDEKAISILEWPGNNEDNELLWMASKDERFSIGSCFNLIHGNEIVEGFNVWKALWSANLQERCRMFL